MIFFRSGHNYVFGIINVNNLCDDYNPMTTPDRFVLGRWSYAYSNPWDYTVTSGTPNGDSATMTYWNPVALGAGSTFSYMTAYGLGGVTTTPGVLSLSITAPTDVQESGTFTAVAYVTNTGQSIANNVVAQISLPPGLTLLSGNNQVNLGNLPANGGNAQASWQVQAGASGDYTFQVVASSDNTDPTSANRNVRVTQTSIPEFPTIVLPIAAIMGLMFVFGRRKV
jgi:uncharacterized repeat protein (TIGR01451 family)